MDDDFIQPFYKYWPTDTVLSNMLKCLANGDSTRVACNHITTCNTGLYKILQGILQGMLQGCPAQQQPRPDLQLSIGLKAIFLKLQIKDVKWALHFAKRINIVSYRPTNNNAFDYKYHPIRCKRTLITSHVLQFQPMPFNTIGWYWQ